MSSAMNGNQAGQIAINASDATELRMAQTNALWLSQELTQPAMEMGNSASAVCT